MKIPTPPVACENPAAIPSASKFVGELTQYPANNFGSDEELWRESVELWMKWHAAQERLTAAMFTCRHDPAQQAELMQEMDQLDQLRWRAVEISQELLSSTPV